MMLPTSLSFLLHNLKINKLFFLPHLNSLFLPTPMFESGSSSHRRHEGEEKKNDKNRIKENLVDVGSPTHANFITESLATNGSSRMMERKGRINETNYSPPESNHSHASSPWCYVTHPTSPGSKDVGTQLYAFLCTMWTTLQEGLLAIPTPWCSAVAREVVEHHGRCHCYPL